MKFIGYFLFSVFLATAAFAVEDDINWSRALEHESSNTVESLNNAYGEWEAAGGQKKIELGEEIAYLRGKLLAQAVSDRALIHSTLQKLHLMARPPTPDEKRFIESGKYFLKSTRDRLLREIEEQLTAFSLNRNKDSLYKLKWKNRLLNATALISGGVAVLSFYFAFQGEQHLYVGHPIMAAASTGWASVGVLKWAQRRKLPKPLNLSNDQVNLFRASHKFWDGFKENSLTPIPETEHERNEWLLSIKEELLKPTVFDKESSDSEVSAASSCSATLELGKPGKPPLLN